MRIFILLLVVIAVFSETDQVTDDFKKLVKDLQNEMKSSENKGDLNELVSKLQNAFEETEESEAKDEKEVAEAMEKEEKAAESEVKAAGWKNWTPKKDVEKTEEVAEAEADEKKEAVAAETQNVAAAETQALALEEPITSSGWFPSFFTIAIFLTCGGFAVRHFMRKSYTYVNTKKSDYGYSKIDETHNLIQRGTYQSGYYQNNDYTAA